MLGTLPASLARGKREKKMKQVVKKVLKLNETTGVEEEVEVVEEVEDHAANDPHDLRDSFDDPHRTGVNNVKGREEHFDERDISRKPRLMQRYSWSSGSLYNMIFKFNQERHF